MVKGNRIEVWISLQKGNELWALPGQLLWDVLVSGGYHVPGECGGRGTCGHCWVRVEGEVSAPGPEEEALRREQGLSPEFRLACRCRVEGPVQVVLPPAPHSVAAKGLYRKDATELEPETRRLPGVVPAASKEGHEPLWERLAQAFSGKELRLRQESWNRLVLQVGKEQAPVVGIAIGDLLVEAVCGYSPRVLGVALDIGTTTLCAALVDLETGASLSVVSRDNPQRAYGADVISRISRVLEDRHILASLNQALIGAVNAMIEEMAGSCGVNPSDVYQIVAVGNPVMLHLFSGLDPSGLGRAPFTGVFRHGLSMPASELGVKMHQQGQIRILPQIGGFVGGDVVAGLLTLKPEAEDVFLYLDIGTNGEMVLHNRGEWWACSAAAGPAFEGGNISSGMRAEPGAVDRVWIEKDGLRFNVLGGGPALGFCGSGLVELVACLLELGYVSSDGTLLSETHEKTAVLELDKDATSGKPRLSISQEDIRQLQLAKAAVRTGVDIMLAAAGLDASELDRVYLAGVFGHHLRPESLLRLGLLPPVSPGAVMNIGNAALNGAIHALLSVKKVEQADLLARSVRHIELAGQPGFQETFLRNLNFPD